MRGAEEGEETVGKQIQYDKDINGPPSGMRCLGMHKLRTIVFAVSTLVVVWLPQLVEAAEWTCPVTNEQFVHEVFSIKNWNAFYKIYKKFIPACPDDGSFAEAYDGMVIEMLTHRWNEINVLNNLVSEDASFGTFVLKHIAIANENELRLVIRNARSRCPATAKKLCAEIERSASEALEDQ